MQTFKKYLVLTLIAVAIVGAQIVNPSGSTVTGAVNNAAATSTRPMREVVGDPSGACSVNGEVVSNPANAKLFKCVAGTWAEIAATGTGDVTAAATLTSTALVTGGGSKAVQTPNASTTLSAAGILTLPADGGLLLGAPAAIAGDEQDFRIGPAKADYDATHIQSAFTDSPYLIGMHNQPNQIVALRVINENNTPNQFLLGIGARTLSDPASGTTPLSAAIEGDAWCAPSGTGVVSNCVGIMAQSNPVATGTGAVTTNTGVQIWTPVVGSVIPTVNYGLYIQPQQGIATTNYSIYQAGSAPNYYEALTFFAAPTVMFPNNSSNASMLIQPGSADKVSGMADGDFWNFGNRLKWYDGTATQQVVGTSTTDTLTNKTLTTPILGSYTVAGLPAAGTAGRLAVVTDATTAGNCTTGGGSALALCRDSGSAWQSTGDGGGGGAASASLAWVVQDTVNASGTEYAMPGATSFNTDETQRIGIAPIAATTAYLKVAIRAGFPADGGTTCTLRVNYTDDTDVEIVVPANQPSPTAGQVTVFQDSGTVSIAEGDAISVKCVNASTSVSGGFGAMTLRLQ